LYRKNDITFSLDGKTGTPNLALEIDMIFISGMVRFQPRKITSLSAKMF
jgi:hypothetical protein